MSLAFLTEMAEREVSRQHAEKADETTNLKESTCCAANTCMSITDIDTGDKKENIWTLFMRLTLTWQHR